MAIDPRNLNLDAFFRGDLTSPVDWLGMHALPEGGILVRAFVPWAERIELLRHESSDVAAELHKVHPEGLFEVLMPAPAAPFKYRYRMHGNGRSWEAEDAYRFGSVLGELDRYLLGEGTHLKAYERLGAHPRTFDGVSGVTFAVWAPNAHRVSVVGPFNHWDGRCHPMQQYAMNGIWELFIPHLVPGELYKFEIKSNEGKLMPLKADPFAFRCEAPPSTASIVNGLGEYAWNDSEWMRERWQRNRHSAPVSIYEMHLGSWRRKANGNFLSYRELAEQLIPYVAEAGFTHVQLLPVSEHPFYPSWGYQPLGLFAPTGRYGSPDDFRSFVDACHQAGLGVLLDWVPAHFPGDDHGLGLFDGTHCYEHADPRMGRHMDWGTLIYNYGRTEVQNFLIANALFWLDQFHIDGLRVDAVASMLYLDYSRKQGEWIPNRFGGRENLEAVAFLRRMNEVVYSQFPDVMTIAEESTAWPMVSRPTASGGLGFGFKWNMGWMHDTLGYLGLNMLHRRYHHTEVTFSMLYHLAENFVLPLSHDEVVHGKKSLLWRMPGSRWEQFANLRLLFAYQMAHPGKKLLFMGGEFGQDHEWDHNRALDWQLLEHEPHQGIRNLARDLNHLYRDVPALHEGDCEPWGCQWVDCEDRKNSTLSMLRWNAAHDDFVLAVLNFTAQPYHGYRVGVPRAGRYREILNSDSRHYGGQDFGNIGSVQAEEIPMHGLHYSVSMTLPPLAAVFLRPE
jgi:1,4-alpha-glucan branching enzyme